MVSKYVLAIGIAGAVSAILLVGLLGDESIFTSDKF